MRRKLRVSLALQPLASALFANSPFYEGKPNGLLSNRAHVWTDVDPDRTGMPSLMFDPNFGFEMFAEWLLDMPMYFIQRHHSYIDLPDTRSGTSWPQIYRRRRASRRPLATLPII